MIRHRESDTDSSEADKRHRLARFNPDINMGTIIQIVVVIVSVVFGYSKIETSIALSSQRADIIEQRAAEQKAATNASLAELKLDVKETAIKINDLKTKIDLIDLKLSQPRK